MLTPRSWSATTPRSLPEAMLHTSATKNDVVVSRNTFYGWTEVPSPKQVMAARVYYSRPHREVRGLAYECAEQRMKMEELKEMEKRGEITARDRPYAVCRYLLTGAEYQLCAELDDEETEENLINDAHRALCFGISKTKYMDTTQRKVSARRRSPLHGASHGDGGPEEEDAAEGAANAAPTKRDGGGGDGMLDAIMREPDRQPRPPSSRPKRHARPAPAPARRQQRKERPDEHAPAPARRKRRPKPKPKPKPRARAKPLARARSRAQKKKVTRLVTGGRRGSFQRGQAKDGGGASGPASGTDSDREAAAAEEAKRKAKAAKAAARKRRAAEKRRAEIAAMKKAKEDAVKAEKERKKVAKEAKKKKRAARKKAEARKEAEWRRQRQEQRMQDMLLREQQKREAESTTGNEDAGGDDPAASASGEEEEEADDPEAAAFRERATELLSRLKGVWPKKTLDDVTPDNADALEAELAAELARRETAEQDAREARGMPRTCGASPVEILQNTYTFSDRTRCIAQLLGPGRPHFLLGVLCNIP